MDNQTARLAAVFAGGVVAGAAIATAVGGWSKAEPKATPKSKGVSFAEPPSALRVSAPSSAPSPAPSRPASAASSSSSSHSHSSSSSASDGAAAANRKPVRVYMDGCFDMMHYGHSNALRQAKACGDILVVGLVNDAEIIKFKGSPPVMNDEERYAALAACKWADEIIRDAPYDLTEEWVNTLVRDHQVDFIVHGDDPCITPDGKDAYAYAKSIGVYKQVKRTEGVSTTDIVGRMLLMTKEHHIPKGDDGASGGAGGDGGDGSGSGIGSDGSRKRTASLRSSSLANIQEVNTEDGSGTPSAGSSSGSLSPSARLLGSLPCASTKFLPTARRIMQFADGKVPKPTDRVVYLCGAFDLFNSGHVAALQEARKLGDFLLVGIHDDATVNALRGHGMPVLNLYERALSLLSCKYVDEVIIGAPWVITDELIKTMNISVVAKGSSSDIENAAGHADVALAYNGADVAAVVEEEYAVPSRMGLLRTFSSPSPMTALNIVHRIMMQREAFEKRYEKKSKAEDAYVAQKSYVQEG